MEYEISEGEDWLFDESTNPSLQRGAAAEEKRKPVTGPHADPADKRTLQKAELFPEEEEHQLA